MTDTNISHASADHSRNPYKAQKVWPPDFTKLDPKHQFRLERRYRRRIKLKWARPHWTKAVKITSWGSCFAVLVYGVLFMDWGTKDTPFQGIRSWFHRQKDSIWTTNPSLTPLPTSSSLNRTFGSKNNGTNT